MILTLERSGSAKPQIWVGDYDGLCDAWREAAMCRVLVGDENVSRGEKHGVSSVEGERTKRGEGSSSTSRWTLKRKFFQFAVQKGEGRLCTSPRSRSAPNNQGE